MGKTRKRGIIDARMTLAPAFTLIGGSNDRGPGEVASSAAAVAGAGAGGPTAGAGGSTTEGET